MSQSNHELQSLTAFQKQTLNELGIVRWQLSDSTQLAPEVAALFASQVARTDEKPAEQPSSGVAENKTSASDVLAQLSNRLSDSKSPAETPAPEPRKVEEVLLQGLPEPLAQDLALAFESLGLKVISKPYDEPVNYPLVISDNARFKDSATHFFATKQLSDSVVKKQLWQAMQQG